MNRHYTWRGRLAVSFAAALGLAGCTSQQAAAPGAPTVPVTVAQVAKKSVPLEIEAIGSVMPYRTVSVEPRSEEHTSELQSLAYLVCRLLLEKKKKKERSTRAISEKTF